MQQVGAEILAPAVARSLVVEPGDEHNLCRNNSTLSVRSPESASGLCLGSKGETHACTRKRIDVHKGLKTQISNKAQNLKNNQNNLT